MLFDVLKTDSRDDFLVWRQKALSGKAWLSRRGADRRRNPRGRIVIRRIVQGLSTSGHRIANTSPLIRRECGIAALPHSRVWLGTGQTGPPMKRAFVESRVHGAGLFFGQSDPL